MDAAIWAVFQEGYKSGFGADADHLKTNEDIDLMINAGFTMFTFDPGEFVINAADSISIDELEKKSNDLNWEKLEDTFSNLINRYSNIEFDLKEGLIIYPTYENVLRAIVKYGNAIAPGYIATENTKALREDAVRNKAILDRIPQGRWGTPEDLMGTVVFLSSDASNYLNGSVVTVDGGWMGR
ncbi:MAG: SDR family oxidoreductase [Ignavibacteriae bacterium]|nr:SDR family oxidoreductase [Ignavibacteriota bacterium]